MFNLSFLKEIDLANPSNLIFFAILAGLVIIVFFILFSIIFKIIKSIGRLIRRIFNRDAKPKFDQKESTDWLREQPQKQQQNLQETISTPNIPKQPIAGGGFVGNLPGKEKLEEKNKNIVQVQKEKSEKDVEAGLSKLKTGGSAGGDTLESKMPSRIENKENDKHEKIEVPVPEKFSVGGSSKSDGAYKSSHSTQANNLDAYKAGSGKESEKSSGKPEEISLYERPDFIENKIDRAADKKIKSDKADASYIFGGEPEISRIKLEYKLRTDPKIWQAAKGVGLTMSPIERSKLVKQIFSSAFGRSISKSDLRVGINKLGKKLLDAKDPAEHAKIRKEIKFFKKIGGIK